MPLGKEAGSHVSHRVTVTRRAGSKKVAPNNTGDQLAVYQAVCRDDPALTGSALWHLRNLYRHLFTRSFQSWSPPWRWRSRWRGPAAQAACTVLQWCSPVLQTDRRRRPTLPIPKLPFHRRFCSPYAERYPAWTRAKKATRKTAKRRPLDPSKTVARSVRCSDMPSARLFICPRSSYVSATW